MSDASESERRHHARVSAGGFAVALSGGGHRATLMAVGALLALVDRRLNRHVMQITSVSGGSITNAFVAQRCDLEQLAPGGLDQLAAELAAIVVQRGVITRGWMISLLGGPVVIAVGFGVLLSRLRVPTTLSAGVGVMIAAGLLIMIGQVVEWLLDRRYFRVTEDRARMSTLSGRAVDHVFSMTDLVLGQPVHVSSQQDGMAWRRLGQLPSSVFKRPPFQTCDAGSRSIAEIVRASAAFPGIPPHRIRFPTDPRNPDVADAPRTAFLADGGLWNNLGSQVLREDEFIGSHATRDDGIPRPYPGNLASAMPLLLVNGSAPLRPARTWPFAVPGLAVLTALLQGSRILNANTVAPRVLAMKQSFQRRVWNADRPDHLDPLDLVVDLSPPNVIRAEYRYPYAEEDIRLTDAAVRNWEQDVLLRVRLQMECDTSSDADRLHYLLQTPEPVGSYPVAGFTEIEGWDTVVGSEAWRSALELDGGAEIAVPTTLGRVDAEVARHLIARGYLNTFLVSLYLTPLDSDDLRWLGQLEQRLSVIMPLSYQGARK